VNDELLSPGISEKASSLWIGDDLGNSPVSLDNGLGSVPFPYMSVLENIKMGAYRRKDKKQIDRDLGELFIRFPVLEKRKGQQETLFCKVQLRTCVFMRRATPLAG
jgi:hypothetical protein